MTVRIIANVPGAPNLKIGDVLELDPSEARAWFQMGVAVVETTSVAQDDLETADAPPRTTRRPRA